MSRIFIDRPIFAWVIAIIIMTRDKVSTLLLFGATGDLAHRMLLPSLYGLHADGLLPDDFRIVCTARSELDDEQYRASAVEALKEHVPANFYDPKSALVFSRRLTYVVLDATKPEGFKRLAKTVDPDAGLAIFLSTAPTLFKAVIDGLEAVGLTGPRVRLALEKPLGTDLESSRVINDAVAIAFPESRTFRIDHYLGKETVQNLLALRFANSMFEPLWNSAHIDHAIHLPAIARAAGIVIDWQDLDELSDAVPLIARIYPNGSGDVNDFHHAGGMAFVTRTLLDAGLLHDDILTAGADRFAAYAGCARLDGDELAWDEVTASRDPGMLVDPPPRIPPPPRKPPPPPRNPRASASVAADTAIASNAPDQAMRNHADFRCFGLPHASAPISSSRIERRNSKRR